jgi:hypothetical protein
MPAAAQRAAEHSAAFPGLGLIPRDIRDAIRIGTVGILGGGATIESDKSGGDRQNEDDFFEGGFHFQKAKSKINFAKEKKLNFLVKNFVAFLNR